MKRASRDALLAVGVLFLIGGGIATMYAVSYHEIEPTSTGYIEYTVKPEAKALFVGALLFGVVLLLIGFTAQLDDDIHWVQPAYPVTQAPGVARFCPYCGAPTMPGGVFCPSCGRRPG